MPIISDISASTTSHRQLSSRREGVRELPDTEGVPFLLTDALNYALKQKSNEGKCSTVRKLTFCLRKLTAYLEETRTPSPILSQLTAEWVDNFADWLTAHEELLPNTRATYLRLIYNVCRQYSDAKRRHKLKAVFRREDMQNSASSVSQKIKLSLAELRAIASLPLSEEKDTVLIRAKSMLLFCIAAGGLRYRDVARLPLTAIENDKLTLSDGRHISLSSFAIRKLHAVVNLSSAYPFTHTDSPLDEDALAGRYDHFNKALALLCQKAGISTMDHIDFDTITTSWNDSDDPAHQIRSITTQLDSERRYWMAVRCLSCNPEELAGQLVKESGNTIDTFLPIVESFARSGSGVKSIRRPLMRSIIFICASLEAANSLRRTIHNRIYIFDHPVSDGSRREISVIPDESMKMFMYFNDIDSTQIIYYFPDELSYPQFDRLDAVIVTEGRWAGAAGKVIGPTAGDPLSVDVAVEFPGMGIAASASVPIRYLRRVSQAS